MNTEKPFENHYVLLKRIPDMHKKAESIRDNISRMEAGLRGETRLLQKQLELRLPCQFKIYSNVRLQMDDWIVQKLEKSFQVQVPYPQIQRLYVQIQNPCTKIQPLNKKRLRITQAILSI